MEVPLATLAAFSESLLAFYAAPTRSAGIEAVAVALRKFFTDADVAISSMTTEAGRATEPPISKAVLIVPIAGTCSQLTLRREKTFSPRECLLVQTLSAHLAQAFRKPEVPQQAAASTALPSSRLAAELGLTPREAEVLRWIAVGKRDAQIAELIGAAPRTVGKHVENILRKLGAETRGGAALIAQERITGQPLRID